MKFLIRIILKEEKMNKSVSKEYVFKRKNNLTSKAFVWFMRKKLNKKTYSIVLRGRHSDRKKLYEKLGKKYVSYTQNDVPIKYAETIGVYIRRK